MTKTRFVGIAVVLVSIAGWLYASYLLSLSYVGNYEYAWLGWVTMAATMSIGLRLLHPGNEIRHLEPYERTFLCLVLVLAAAFRLWNYWNFPPSDGIAQIEELQTGLWGSEFLRGARRWEFVGCEWVGAIGIWLGGPTLTSLRLAYTACGILAILPAFFLFRNLAGSQGAMIGTFLLATSGWVTMANRLTGLSHDGLVILCTLALLAGPAMRGAWWCYPWIGLLAGYTTYTYIGNRLLIPVAMVGVFMVAVHRWRSFGKRDMVMVLLSWLLIGAMFVPITYRLHENFTHYYFNGWHRTYATPYYSTDSLQSFISKRIDRVRIVSQMLFVTGDGNYVHTPGGYAVIDPITSVALGIGALASLAGGLPLLIRAAFLISFLGSLVITGNIDAVRAVTMIPYVFALAAIGSGLLCRIAQRGGRIVYRACVACFVVACLYSTYWNGKFLVDLWASPLTQKAYRHDLTYLSLWLQQHAQNGEIMGVGTGTATVVCRSVGHDGAWLHPDAKCTSYPDIDTAMKAATPHTKLVFFTDMADGTHIQKAKELGLHMTAEPNDADPRLFYARLP